MPGLFQAISQIIDVIGTFLTKLLDASQRAPVNNPFWTESTTALVIGGLIGIIPTIIHAYLDHRKLKTQQRYDLQIKHMESYEKPRMEAILDFIQRLGAMCSDNISSIHETADFFASYHKARVYVSDDTKVLMDKASQIVHASWVENRDISSSEMLKSGTFMELSNAIGKELKSLNSIENPSSGRKRK